MAIQLVRGVCVAAGGEVAALEQRRRVRGEVVAGSAVAAGGSGHLGPVVAAEQHRVPGDPVVRGAGPDGGPGTPCDGQDAAVHAGADVGEVDEGDEGRLDVGAGRLGEVGETGAERGAHPLLPVGGDHDLGVHRLGQGGGPLRLGAEDDDDPFETGVHEPVEGGLEEGRAVRGGADEGLRATHPASGSGGEEQADGRHDGQPATGYRRDVAHELSRRDARRVAVRAQWLTTPRPDDALGLVRHLGLVQMDLTAHVAPNADLVLWSRLGGAYSPEVLDDLLESRALVEVQGFLRPAEDVALYRAEMEAWPGPEPVAPWLEQLDGWLAANRTCHDDILTRLRSEGPLPAREIPDTCAVPWRSSGWTNSKNVQRMMDLLEARGEVAVSSRENRERTWDLAERVYPEVEAVPVPDARRERDRRRLAALGIARSRAPVTPTEPDDVGEAGEEAVVAGVRGQWRVDPRYLDAGFSGRTALLSPLDRLVFDRRRMAELFEFDYQLEMYKPAAKRRWGYFALPVLHGDRLVGKVDAQSDLGAGLLRVHAVHWDVEPSGAMRDGVERELRSLAAMADLEVLRETP